MKYQNNATLVWRNLLVQIAKAFLTNQLTDNIDRILIEHFPKNKKEIFRCCVYKERAIVRQRILSLLGFGVEDDDELTPLRNYVKRALVRDKSNSGDIFSVLDIACSGCIESQYFITNACRACMARPCTLNCPREAISIVNKQAIIDKNLCIDCGICAKICPYHAIIRVSVPCEEACPVGAISKSAERKIIINFDKCIFCGQCMIACPFGAVMEKSEVIDVLKLLINKQNVAALIAPAIAGGQFKGNLKQIANALQKLGFTRVVEVAGGADITSEHEAKEFAERMAKGDEFMTSSCCPAYTQFVEKHAKELQRCVSIANTPMHYTAEIVKKSDPNVITVFIGPCIAKKKEAKSDSLVDCVLTFEELDALFEAKGIDISKCQESELENEPSNKGRGFATTCGVTEALLVKANKDLKIKTEFIDGLNKNTIKKLKSYEAKKPDCNFLEVMGCEGGCIGGPCAIGKLQVAKKAIHKISNN